jgi:glycosyltransferase involved in cell wall biosynthesis
MTRPSELLVVAFHFPPLASSGTFRTLSFVRHLSRLGWRSTVVTVDETSAAPRDEALLDKVPAGTSVLRVRSGDPVAILKRIVGRGGAGNAPPAATAPARLAPPSPRRGGLFDTLTRCLQLPDKESPFQATAAIAALRAFDGVAPPDAVFASGPPMSGLVAGAIAARALGAPLVADFRDPWTANPFRDLPNAFLRGVDSLLERFVLRTARVSIFNTPPARDALAAAHPEIAAERLVVIENGFDPDELPLAAESSGEGEGGLTFLHTGVLYGRRDPTPFLHAVRDVLSGDPSLGGTLRVRFVGFPGDARFTSDALRDAAGGDSRTVSVEGSVPHATALAEMVRADVLLLLGVTGAGPEVQVPAKLFEYLATGRPIFATCHPNGAIAAVLRESRARVFSAPPDDAAAIAAALRQVVAAAKRGELVRGPSFLPDRFDRARQAERLDRLLRAACYSRAPQFALRETPIS